MARGKVEIVNSIKNIKAPKRLNGRTPNTKIKVKRAKLEDLKSTLSRFENRLEAKRLSQRVNPNLILQPPRTTKSISTNLINLIDYMYYDIGENDIEDMYNAINQGDANSLEIQKLNEKISAQYECLYNVYLLLDKTGQLSELLSLENKNIEALNEVLSIDNQIEKLSPDGFKTMINNIDLNKKEDVIKMLVFNRQLLNRLGHNYEETICIRISNQCKSSTEYIKEKKEFIAEIFRIADNAYETCTIDDYGKKMLKMIEISKIFKPDKNSNFKDVLERYLNQRKDKSNDKIKNLLEREILKSIAPRDLRSYDQDNYAVDVYFKMIEFMKQFNKTMESDKNNGINPPEFHDFLNKVLKDDKIDNIHGLFTRVVKKTTVKGEVVNVKENLIDKIKNYVKRLEKDGYMKNPVATLIEISKDLEIEEKFMKAKHITTMMLVRQYELGSNQLYIENDSAQNGMDGVLDVYLDGYLQVFGGHYKPDELEATDQRVQSLNSVRPDVNLGFEQKSRGIDLSVGVPMQKLTEGQVREFRELTRTIDFLEGRMGTEEVDKSTLPKLELLEGYKEKDPSLYNILKVRILLGAGLDKFKEFYGIDDKQRFSVKNMLSVEQIRFAEQMVGIIRNNMMTLETLKNSVDPMVFDFISLELQRGNDVKSVLNSSMAEHISNEGQNREGTLLTRQLRGDIQQEQAD